MLALGHRAANDRVLDAVDVDARRLRDHGIEHVGKHVVGTGIAEHALGRLAHRGAGGGDDVGVLVLFHGSLRKPRLGIRDWGFAKANRSEEHTSELQSIICNPYVLSFLKKKNITAYKSHIIIKFI